MPDQSDVGDLGFVEDLVNVSSVSLRSGSVSSKGCTIDRLGATHRRLDMYSLVDGAIVVCLNIGDARRYGSRLTLIFRLDDDKIADWKSTSAVILRLGGASVFHIEYERSHPLGDREGDVV